MYRSTSLGKALCEDTGHGRVDWDGHLVRFDVGHGLILFDKLSHLYTGNVMQDTGVSKSEDSMGRSRAPYLLFSQEAKVPCVIESAMKGVLMIFEAVVK